MSTPPSGTHSPINQLIHEYRSGEAAAAEELLLRFEGYLQKWERLLIHGTWNGRDSELRHFLQMMGCVDMAAGLYSLCRRLKAYDPEDITQEIRVAFLDTALRCSSIRFHYRYTLHRRVVALVRDPSVFSSDRRVPLPHNLAAPDEPDIDESWVQGITCGPGFEDLSVRERRILQLTKWRGYSTEQAANTLEISDSTVTRAIRRAKAVLHGVQ